jgi:hypothetical protein
LPNLEQGVEDIRRIGAEAVISAVLTWAVVIDFVLRQAVEFANPKNRHCFPMATL